jgi:MerR family mercuric resistance operon transcriptional regulator
MPRMTIGRFAREAGVGVETVRYYHRRGLLPMPAAGSTSYREYDEALLRRLGFIRRAQAAGFTLEEIRELLRLDRGRDRRSVRQLAQRKLVELESRLADLRDLARALRAVVHACDRGDLAAPCPIIEAFERETTPGSPEALPRTPVGSGRRQGVQPS